MNNILTTWACVAIVLVSCHTSPEHTKEGATPTSPTSEGQPQSQLQLTNQALIQGKWVSTEDEKSEIEAKGNRWIEMYDGEKMGDNPFQFNNLCSDTLENEPTAFLAITGEDTLCYSIEELSKNNLTLMYTENGNLLSYQRK